MIKEELLNLIGKWGVIPVVTINNLDSVIPLGRTLIESDLPCAEITFRTEAAEETIRKLSRTYPDLVIGAGTVLNVVQAKKAISLGASFIVSPGFDRKIVSYCCDHNILVFPGVATPTEINMALDCDVNVLKFFPAEALGGLKMLKAISAPYRSVKFIPTGGVNAQNLEEYLNLSAVYACGGSWFVKEELIEQGDFEQISLLIEQALTIVQKVRKKGEDAPSKL